MVRRGEIIIAWDPDIRDMYICEVLRGDEETQRNLLVRVLEMVQYPIQHAIMHPEIASENPPFRAGSSAMLRFVSRVGGEQPAYVDAETEDTPKSERVIKMQKMADYYRAMDTRGYKASFDKALSEYEGKLRAALTFREKYPLSPLSYRNPEELEILERHKKRIFNGRRSSGA